MSNKLYIQGGGQTKAYECKTTHTGSPFLKVSAGYLDLTTNTTSGLQLKIKNGNQTYRPLQTYSTTASRSSEYTETTGYTGKSSTNATNNSTVYGFSIQSTSSLGTTNYYSVTSAGTRSYTNGSYHYHAYSTQWTANTTKTGLVAQSTYQVTCPGFIATGTRYYMTTYSATNTMVYWSGGISYVRYKVWCSLYRNSTYTGGTSSTMFVPQQHASVSPGNTYGLIIQQYNPANVWYTESTTSSSTTTKVSTSSFTNDMFFGISGNSLRYNKFSVGANPYSHNSYNYLNTYTKINTTSTLYGGCYTTRYATVVYSMVTSNAVGNLVGTFYTTYTNTVNTSSSTTNAGISSTTALTKTSSRTSQYNTQTEL